MQHVTIYIDIYLHMYNDMFNCIKSRNCMKPTQLYRFILTVCLAYYIGPLLTYWSQNSESAVCS